MNKPKLDSLPATYQKVLIEAAHEDQVDASPRLHGSCKHLPKERSLDPVCGHSPLVIGWTRLAT